MIKKMERLKNMAWGQEPEFHLLCLANFNGIIDTVNKVIDTVNRLLAEVAENARIRANHEKKIDELQEYVQGAVDNSIKDGAYHNVATTLFVVGAVAIAGVIVYRLGEESRWTANEKGIVYKF